MWDEPELTKKLEISQAKLGQACRGKGEDFSMFYDEHMWECGMCVMCVSRRSFQAMCGGGGVCFPESVWRSHFDFCVVHSHI